MREPGRNLVLRGVPSGPMPSELDITLARALATLPDSVLRVIAGRPIRIDGQQLDVELQILLRLRGRTSEPSLEASSVPQVREQVARETRALAGRPLPLDRREALDLPGPAGPLHARLYSGAAHGSRPPLLVYFHGGGFVTGDLDTHDNTCRFLAAEAGVMVLAVAYRLAPEHPFPAAVDDALAAFCFARENATQLGADPNAIAVAGDSSGGSLATIVCHETSRENGPAPLFQLLLCPVTDLSRKSRSYQLFGDGFLLTEGQMDWFRKQYLVDDSAALDYRASPLLADTLNGLPPAYVVTAGFDILRDEGEEYAHRLSMAGIPVALRRHPSLTHGFVTATGLGQGARAALFDAGGALRVGLELAAS
jgi:acetyl esterase